MNALESLTKSVGIDWTKVNIWWDSGRRLNAEFGVSPQEYLDFAYQDSQSNDTRGCINAISNAKRSSECQIDEFCACLGYINKELPKNVTNYVEKYSPTTKNLKILPKLKLLNALDVAPLVLILKMRSTRNKVEYQYKLPNKDETTEAIEIAELFNAKVNNALMNFGEGILLRSDDKQKKFCDWILTAINIVSIFMFLLEMRKKEIF